MLPLLALLPLLASLALANPAPRHPGEPADLLERGPYGATALGFEAIGDMGISAQMVSASGNDRRGVRVYRSCWSMILLGPMSACPAGHVQPFTSLRCPLVLALRFATLRS
jgi:hypothetical protein